MFTQFYWTYSDPEMYEMKNYNRIDHPLSRNEILILTRYNM